MNPRLEAALDYARRGWAVFPLHGVRADGRCTCGNRACANVGKHPRGDLVDHGVTQATTSRATIEAWWRIHPDSNIGIATGKASGIAVLDVDAQKGGFETLALLEMANGALPATIRVRTGGGGQHVYFAFPGVHLGNSSGKLGAGLDIRCCGGYVVAPPSRHASGQAYAWLDEAAP